MLSVSSTSVIYILSLHDALPIFVKEAISYRVAVISNQVIDQINILEATKQAMRTCLAELDPEPDHVLIDSVKLRSEEHTSELQSRGHLVCRLLLEKKNVIQSADH